MTEITPGQLWEAIYNRHVVRVVRVEDGIRNRKPCKLIVYTPHSYKEGRKNRRPIRAEVFVKKFRLEADNAN